MIDTVTDGASAGADDTSVVETPAVETPASDAPAERSFDDVRNDIADKILSGDDAGDLTKELDGVAKGPNRGPDGKFAPKAADAVPAPNTAVAAPVVDPAVASAPDAVKQPVEDKGHGRQPPGWLAPEAKDAWAKAPAPVVDAFMKRAREFESANSNLGRENKQLAEFHANHTPFAEVAERHRNIWEGAGFQHPAQAMDALMQNHQFAMTDDIGFTVKNIIGDKDPRSFIAALAKATNTDIAGLVLEPAPDHERSAPQQRQAAPTRQIDPDAIYQQAEQRVREEYETQRNQAFLDDFRAKTPVIGVNAYGETVHEFDEVATDLSIALETIKRSNPNLGPQDLLNAAYSKAVLLNDGARARKEAADQEQARAASAEAAKKQATTRFSQSARRAASINVTGSPNRNPAPVDVRALQQQALDEMGYTH